MRPDSARRLLTALFLVLPAAHSAAQVLPFALQGPGGAHEIWQVDAVTGKAGLVLEEAQFLPIELAGYPPRDRLALYLPRAGGEEEPAPHVLLPNGGALYLVEQPAGTSLLHVSATGVPRVALTVAGGPGGASLRTQVGVSTDGLLVLLASTMAAGGDVLLVDLAAEPASVSNLSASTPELGVDGDSLRVSREGAFFVASQVLWRAPAGSAALAVDPGLGDEPVLADLALSADGRRVAAVTGPDEVEDGNRRIFVADISGPTVLVTPEPGRYDTPEHDDPLGPFLALADDGSMVAFRAHLETQELFVKEVDLPDDALQLTVEPAFPAYLDNVGILGFAPGRKLFFFGGDVTISGVDAQELIGAADFYLAELPAGGDPTFLNLSLTSGQSNPPYSSPGQLRFSEAVLDPLGQRYLLVGEDDDDFQNLASVALNAAYGEAVTQLLTGVDSDPQLVHAATGVLIVSELETEFAGSQGSLTRLDLLASLHAKADGQVIPLGVLPSELELDRFVASGGGERAAFVVSLGPGLELPVLVDLPSGVLVPAWWGLLGVSPMLAFAGSDLLAGLGGGDGPFKFAAFSAPGAGKLLGLPVSAGFPLPH